MKKTFGRIRQWISVLLAAAMVITCVPQTGLPALAAEAQTNEEPAAAQPGGTEIPEGIQPGEGGEAKAPEGTQPGDGGEKAPEETQPGEGSEAETPEGTQPDDGGEKAPEETQPGEGGETETPEGTQPGEGSEAEAPEETQPGEGDETETPEETQPEEGTGAALPSETVSGNAVNAVYTADADAEEPAQESWRVMINRDRYAGTPEYVVYTDASEIESAKWRPCSAGDFNEGITVLKGKSLAIRFPRQRVGYVVSVKNGDESGEPQEVPAGQYVCFENITGDMSIEVTAEERTYLVAAAADNATNVELRYSGAQRQNDGTYRVKANAILKVNIVPKKNEFIYGIGRIKRVGYQWAGEDTVHEFALTENQSYKGGTFELPKVWADVTIYVETDQFPAHTVTFQYDAAKVDVTGDIPDDNGKKVSQMLEPGKAYQLREWPTNTMPFQPVLKAGSAFQITDVTVSEGIRMLQSEETVGRYILADIKQDVTVQIATSLDPGKCNNLTIAADGHADAFTVSVSGLVDGDDDYGKENITYAAGDTVLTQAQALTAAILPEEGYQIEKVELDGKGIAADGAQKSYQISFSGKTGKKSLKVYTKPTPTEEEKTVAFTRAADNSSAGLQVTETDKITKKEEDIYTVAAGAAYLDFTVTMEGSEYDPALSYADGDGQGSTDIHFRGKEGNIYRYSIAANRLPENAVIRMEKREVTQTVRVVYDSAEVQIAGAKIGNGSVEGMADTKGITYTVPRGQTITVRAEAKEHCRIMSAQTTMNGTAKTENTEEAGFMFSVKADADAVTEIESEGVLNVRPLQEVGGGDLTPVNGVYQVSCYKSYRGSVMQGTAIFFHDKVEVKVNGKAYDIADEEVPGLEIQNESTSFVISPSEDVAGKTIEVNLYTKEGEDNEEEGTKATWTKVASYKLKVAAVLDDKDVKINGGKAILQAADTVNGSYQIAVTKNTDVNDLVFEVPSGDENKDVVREAKIVNGRLEITTGFGVGESTELTVCTEADGNRRAIQQNGENLTVKVTAARLLDKEKTAAPAVKQASSTDVSLTLSLGAKGVPAAKNGKVYYEVKLTPDLTTAAEADRSKLLADVPVQYFEKTGDVQEETVFVGASNVYGTGAACQYAITVRLVHTENAVTGGTQLSPEQIKGESGVFQKTASKDFATKDPTYETNLRLKKAASTVYTGQTAVAAIPQFSRETSFTQLPEDGASDITSGLSEAERLEVSIVKNQVQVTAKTTTRLGKHTIEVLAATTDGKTMYASRATIAVTVVRGIEDLTIHVPTDSIYYPNKAVNLKTTAAYNTSRNDANPKDSVPKAKKVEYRLVSADTEEAFLKNMDAAALMAVPEAAVAKAGVKIDKSGKITIPKGYQVTADSTFKVLAKAADYKENTVFALSDEITITREYMQIARAVIVKHNPDRQVFEVIHAEGEELNASALDGAQIVACAAGLPDREFYCVDGSAAALDTYWITQNVTYASSNKKAVEIDARGNIKVNAPAKKVKLTVAPADGSAADKKRNTTKTITTTVKYDDVSELGLTIIKAGETSGDNTPSASYDVNEIEKTPMGETREIKYSDSSTATFVLRLKSKDGEGWADATRFTDYKIAVTKGKVLPAGTGRGIQTRIAANDKQTTVKLTYKVYNETTGRYDSKAKEYKLTNIGLAAAVEAKIKAPKVVFRNKRSTIQANYTPADKNLETWKDDDGTIRIGSRYIGFNLQPNGNSQAYPLDFENAKVKETGEDLYVKVDVDWSAMTAKNEDMLRGFADSMTPQGYQKLNSSGNHGGYVHLTFANEAVLTPGSYKLKVSVGTIDDNLDFVPAAQPAAITLKVAKDKALSFKPATAYKISAKDGGYTELTGKGSYDYVRFTGLQNANMRGKQKGKENAFTTYFELAKDADGNGNILKLTDDCFDAATHQLKDIPPQDLIGYVSYEAGYYYTQAVAPTVRGTVKITVKLENTRRKYSVTNAAASKDAGAVAKVAVTADKQPIPIAYAAVKEAEGEWEVVIGSGDSWTSGSQVNGSDIFLRHTGAIESKTAKVTLLVIPEDSYYTKKIDQAEAVDGKSKEDVQKEIIIQNGVELKTTVTLNDLSVSNKRIAVDKVNLTQQFTAEHRKRESGVESGYDPAKGEYYITVPYTELYVNASAGITGILSEGKYRLVSFSRAETGTALNISMSKMDLLACASDKPGDFYSYRDEYDFDTYSNPKTISFTAKICYGGTKETPGEPCDQITFRLKMPEFPGFDRNGYETAVSYLEQMEGDISASVAEDMQRYRYADLRGVSGEALDKSVKEYVTGYLEDHIRGYVREDCGIDLRNLQERMEVATGSTGYRAPTNTEPGSVVVRVKLNNGKKDNGRRENTVIFSVALPAFGATAEEAAAAVREFLAQAKVTNQTTRETLLEELKAYVNETVKYDSGQIRYTVTKFEKTPAEMGGVGSIALEIRINSLVQSGTSVTVSRTGADALVIRLLNAEQVIEAVSEAVGVSGPNKEAVVKKLTYSNSSPYMSILEAAEKAIEGTGYRVYYNDGYDENHEWFRDYHFEAATKTTKGKLSFTLLVQNEDLTPLDPDDPTFGKITLPETALDAIPELLTGDEATEKVKAWLEANTLATGEDASDSSLSKVLKNGVTEEDILHGLTAAGCVPSASRVIVSLEDVRCVDATAGEDGFVKGTVWFHDLMPQKVIEMRLDVVIPALPKKE